MDNGGTQEERVAGLADLHRAGILTAEEYKSALGRIDGFFVASLAQSARPASGSADSSSLTGSRGEADEGVPTTPQASQPRKPGHGPAARQLPLWEPCS